MKYHHTIKVLDNTKRLYYIYIIDSKELQFLLQKYINKLAFCPDEINLFLTREHERWLAIDNTTESLLIEEFDVLNEAIQYLVQDYFIQFDETNFRSFQKIFDKS